MFIRYHQTSLIQAYLKTFIIRSCRNYSNYHRSDNLYAFGGQLPRKEKIQRNQLSIYNIIIFIKLPKITFYKVYHIFERNCHQIPWLFITFLIFQMDGTLIIKMILMLAFFLEVTIFGNLVSSLACFSNKNIMDLAMTFSGSLFLSIALIDVIPEAIEHFDQFLSSQSLQYEGSSLHRGKLPLTMIIAMITLILIMWLDKIVIGHSHDHEYEISFVAGPKKNEEGQKSVEMREHPHDQFHGVGAGSQRHHDEQKQLKQGESKQINWKPFILQAGMSIHAFFQTLAVGLQGSVMNVLGLATAILVHKWAEGLTLGLLYKKQGFSPKTVTMMIILQGLVNVIGLLTGSLLMGQGSFIMAFFMSMSAGTFLYISLVQVLQQQLKSYSNAKMIMIVAANLFVTGIVWLEKSEEGGEG